MITKRQFCVITDICVALGGFLASFSGAWRALTVLAGLALIVLAVAAGTHVNDLIHYRNALSEQVAGHASPGAGVWTVGAGGVLLMTTAFFVKWER